MFLFFLFLFILGWELLQRKCPYWRGDVFQKLCRLLDSDVLAPAPWLSVSLSFRSSLIFSEELCNYRALFTHCEN